MPKIIRSRAALGDAARIWAYVARDNEAAADALIDRFDEKLRVLADNPRLGTPRHELRPELRSFAVGNYILFYRSDPEGIRVVRFLHGALEIRRALGDE